jgi:hypothetical protein
LTCCKVILIKNHVDPVGAADAYRTQVDESLAAAWQQTTSIHGSVDQQFAQGKEVLS